MELLIGISGAVLILLSFLLVQTNKLDPEDLIYEVINFIGSILLIIYSVNGRAYPFIILNTVLAIASLYGIINYFYKKSKHNSITDVPSTPQF